MYFFLSCLNGLCYHGCLPCMLVVASTVSKSLVVLNSNVPEFQGVLTVLRGLSLKYSQQAIDVGSYALTVSSFFYFNNLLYCLKNFFSDL